MIWITLLILIAVVWIGTSIANSLHQISRDVEHIKGIVVRQEAAASEITAQVSSTFKEIEGEVKEIKRFVVRQEVSSNLKDLVGEVALIKQSFERNVASSMSKIKQDMNEINTQLNWYSENKPSFAKQVLSRLDDIRFKKG
jgi:hypothetical protein